MKNANNTLHTQLLQISKKTILSTVILLL